MVQIISPSPAAMQAGQIGQALGIGINKNFPDPQMLVQRQMLQKALSEAKQSIRQPGATPLDKMFSFMEAGAGIPGSERYMGSLLPLVQELTQADAAQRAPFGIPDQGTTQQTPIEGHENLTNNVNDQLNKFLNPQAQSQNAFFPSNVGEKQATGNLPQVATKGVKLPIASNQDLLNWSKPYALQKTAAGIPTKPEQAYKELKAINEDNKIYNQQIEEERKERVTSQREYGNIAANKLAKIMPDAGDEEIAYIKKQIEELAGENASEADIERLAAAEARKYKNMIYNISKDIPASRVYNRPFQDLMGTSKSADKARKDLRIKVQPLLDAGLYDKARNVLSERGYYPEEREMIITDLGENALKTISQLPRIPGSAELHYEDGYSGGEETVNMIKNNIKNMLQTDPSVNLILARRKYDLDKNIDWRTFKDAVNEAIDEGIFKPNGDQFNQLDNLDQPPLNTLERILYGIGIIGR